MKPASPSAPQRDRPAQPGGTWPGEAFDAYYKWLGIPPKEQPPHHYRLLGLVLFESDPEVIEALADQRVAFLQNCQIGEHVAESQALLNKVAAASVCLLNPARKAAYDAQLRAQLQAGGVSGNLAPEPFPVVDMGTSPSAKSHRVRRPRSTGSGPETPTQIIGGVLAGLLVIGLVLWLWPSTPPQAGSAAKQQPPAARSDRLEFVPIKPQRVLEARPIVLGLPLAKVPHSAENLRYTLHDLPPGADFDPERGLFRWTPDESQGSQTHRMTAEVFLPERPKIRAQTTLVVEVIEVNTAPVITPLPLQIFDADREVRFPVSATDIDQPANRLTFSLSGEVPSGFTIDPQTGIVHCPREAVSADVYSLTVRVTDNGSPPRSSEQFILVQIGQPSASDDALATRSAATPRL